MVALAVFCTHRNSDGNLYVRYLYWNGGNWQADNNWLDNDWDSNNPAAVSATFFTFTLLFARGVLFCELPAPSAKHLAYLVEWSRECDVLCIL